MPKNIFVIISVLSLVLLFIFANVNSVLAVCSEPNASQYLVCEDWDTGPYPAQVNWPCQNCPVWQGWEPSDTLMSTLNAISTSQYHSGNRSLKIQNQLLLGSEHAGGDIYHVTGNNPIIYIRLYLKMTNINGGSHFIFINTASAAHCCLGFKDCQSTAPYEGCDIGHYLTAQSYAGDYESKSYNQPTGSPFNWDNHLNEWHLVEWKVNVPDGTTSLWIDEVSQLTDYHKTWSLGSDSSYAHDVIISGWGLGGDSTYYIDDVVISTSYIGPRNDSQPVPDTTPPSPPTGISVS